MATTRAHRYDRCDDKCTTDCGHAPLWAMVTAGGVAIQESAVCEKHLGDAAVVGEASDLGRSADDIGDDTEFYEFDATYVENNDLHCIGCSWDKSIDKEIKSRPPLSDEQRIVFKHDARCESEFIVGPMAYAPCDCDRRRLSARETDLRTAAHEDVRMMRAALEDVLPGSGAELADTDDLLIVSRIVGYDVRTRATGTYGRPNVALLRSSLRRWAVRESCGLRPTDGAA